MTGLPTEVKKFLSENSLATIATSSNDNDYPYVIPVYYVILDNSYLYFASHKGSKTLHNILSHPHISISITNHSDLIQLQLQGTAMVVEHKTEIIEKIIEISNKKSENNMPPILQIETGVMELVTFVVHWYKLSDYSKKNLFLVRANCKINHKGKKSSLYPIVGRNGLIHSCEAKFYG
jgi:uncharacterized pyridoxamine 5'-phosphate oxidase family protein